MKYSTFTILFLNKRKLLSCCKTDSIPHHVLLLFVRITNTDGVFFYERNKCLALIKTTLFLAAGSLSKCASKHLYVLHFPAHRGSWAHGRGCLTSINMHRRSLQHLHPPNCDCNGKKLNKCGVHKNIITDLNWRSSIVFLWSVRRFDCCGFFCCFGRFYAHILPSISYIYIYIIIE